VSEILLYKSQVNEVGKLILCFAADKCYKIKVVILAVQLKY